MVWARWVLLAVWEGQALQVLVHWVLEGEEEILQVLLVWVLMVLPSAAMAYSQVKAFEVFPPQLLLLAKALVWSGNEMLVPQSPLFFPKALSSLQAWVFAKVAWALLVPLPSSAMALLLVPLPSFSAMALLLVLLLSSSARALWLEG